MTSSGTAIITGGASGIGLACTRHFAKAGYAVVVLDINEQSGRSAVARIKDTGGTAHYYTCDVADRNQVDTVAALVQSEIGSADILVTAAGLIPNTESILDMDMERHDRMWAVNYHGTLHACRAFGRQMREQGWGSIVTLCSINSVAPLPLPAYNPGKVALQRLTQLLAVELGRHGIRVNAVAPTYVLTDGLQDKIDQGLRDLDKIMNAHALSALPDSDDVAKAVVFLCSASASRITGVMLPVDSGWSAAISYKTYAGGVPWD